MERLQKNNNKEKITQIHRKTKQQQEEQRKITKTRREEMERIQKKTIMKK